ncbi:MAG TPA: diacylglycerol kinase family protein [Gaiellaceae bacterium]|nr:diacylglycerol kinase family protein [Gaiellaceae bacterium]
MRSPDAAFLVNPASGNGATGRRWPRLRERARELGLAGEALVSERPGHLTELARAAAAEHELLVVVGGDGTLNEVVNGLAGRPDAEIAVLPAGTGQDFGRTYGIPTRFDDAIRVALEGETMTIDLGRASFGGRERYFANVGSVGMSGAVALRANSMTKALGGRITFYYALAREFARWRNTEVTIAFEGGGRRGPMHDVVVANGQWHAGGMWVAPEASFDDGLFDVVVIGDVTKLDFLTTSPRLYRGGHVRHPRVEVLRSSWLSVEAAAPLPIELEGEPVGTTPVRFEVVPAALRVRVPRRR